MDTIVRGHNHVITINCCGNRLLRKMSQTVAKKCHKLLRKNVTNYCEKYSQTDVKSSHTGKLYSMLNISRFTCFVMATPANTSTQIRPKIWFWKSSSSENTQISPQYRTNVDFAWLPPLKDHELPPFRVCHRAGGLSRPPE